MPTGQTNPRRILVVEDEMLLAMNLEDMLAELGHSVVAIATRVAQAKLYAENHEIDLAILDLNLSGSLSFPVADILRKRGVPFLFATGYGSNGLTEKYCNEFVLAKPYGLRELESAINLVISVPSA